MKTGTAIMVGAALASVGFVGIKALERVERIRTEVNVVRLRLSTLEERIKES